MDTGRTSDTSGSLAAVLDDARSSAFVGRRSELAAFESALDGAGRARLLLAHGPGGIGKTTLLLQFRIMARRRGRPVVHLDARDIDCSPEQFRLAYRHGLAVAAAGTDHPVLLVDGYDRLVALDEWMRSDFLPTLPAESVVALVGRETPATAWRTDPGWRALATVHRLGPLTEPESAELLDRCAVPGVDHRRLVELGRGHPLTLALLADSASVPESLADAPDLVAALVTRIVGDAPTPAHTLGLALCTVSWLTTEELLRSGVGDRAPEVWSWLESRPFITRGRDGLYPHELVRDVLEADLRTRAPDRYRAAARIVHQQAIAAMRSSDVARRDLGAHQKLYLHRRSPLYASFWALRDVGAAAVVRGRPEDHPEIIDMITAFEGEESSSIAARWLEAQPDGLSVVRSPAGVAGFCLQVLYPADPGLVGADPVVAAAIAEASTTSPARPGEQISVGRFLGGRTPPHQRDAYAVLAACVGSTIMWIRRPLAWSFVTTIDPQFWGPSFDYLGLSLLRTATIGERRYSIYGIDWRRTPIDAWLELMAERELTGESGPIPPELQRPAPLGRARFDEAVRLALRDLSRPDRLSGNDLVGTRLVAADSRDPGSALRTSIVEAVAEIGGLGQNAPLGRVLDRTFVHAAPTQEAAAAVLDLPFSTYRRHLAKAIDELTDALWSIEIGRTGGSES